MFLEGQSVLYRARHKKRGFVQAPIIGKVMSVSKCGTKVNIKYKGRCDMDKRITVGIESVEALQ